MKTVLWQSPQNEPVTSTGGERRAGKRSYTTSRDTTILSLTLFEKTSLIQLLAESEHTMEESGMSNQLDLFGY
jgi:hypothetical protein